MPKRKQLTASVATSSAASLTKAKGKKSKTHSSSRTPNPSPFAALYGQMCLRMCYLWTCNDGSDGDWPPPRHTYQSTDNEWTMVFQPHKDDAMELASLIFYRSGRSAITKTMWRAIESDVASVHRHLVESFREVTSEVTGHKWFDDIAFPNDVDVDVDSPDARDSIESIAMQLLRIEKPLTLSDDARVMKLTFSYHLKCDDTSMQRYWYPTQLANAVGDLPEFFDATVGPRYPFLHDNRLSKAEALDWNRTLDEFVTRDLQYPSGWC